MHELLEELDNDRCYKTYADVEWKDLEYVSLDGFLYARCNVLLHGLECFMSVLKGKNRKIWSESKEELLYVVLGAWNKKYKEDDDKYDCFYDYVQIWVIIEKYMC